MKLHLVDGTFELFRCWFGAPRAQGPDGVEIGAVRGLLRTLLALLQEEGVTHVGVAFDHVIESFRNELFEGYKTGEGVDPELLGQFELAERACRALGVVVWPMVEFEADDALATAAARFRDRVDQVQICSPDKDLAQCVVGDRVVTRDRIRGTVLDEGGVREKFGVLPRSIPDWLALVGDTADGIPGIPGWGAKSAAAVLARYGHIEDIPPSVDRWDLKVRGAPKLSERLEAQRDDALLYRRLATLRTDAPVHEELDDLRWRGAHRAELRAICAELGWERFLDRVPRWA